MSKNKPNFTVQFPQENTLIQVMDAQHNGKVDLHDHVFFELVYIDKGFAMHSWQNENMILTSGDLLIISPGQVHAYIAAYHTNLYNCLFLPEALNGEIELLSKLPGLDILDEKHGSDSALRINLDLNERQQILKYLEKMRWELLNKPVGWQLKIKSLLVELLISYSRIYNSRGDFRKENNSYMQYVYTALEYISDNCDNDFMIKDIADHIGISPDYLTKHFKAALGISPMEYVKNFRIAKAMELLKQTDKTVSQISEEIGFSDISHFSRQFKQVTGTSPTIFRKENLH